MKRTMKISALIIFALVFIIPQTAFSAAKISLKNGREIIADSCRDSDTQLICEKMGGTFEIEKKDILELKGIVIKRKQADENPLNTTTETEVQTEGVEKSDDGSSKIKAGEKILLRGVNPEKEKRLDEISKRKLELKEEGERLAAEREQLHKDVKEMDMLYSQEQYDRITKRISGIEERISRFNEEVKKLNEEESRFITELNKNE